MPRVLTLGIQKPIKSLAEAKTVSSKNAWFSHEDNRADVFTKFCLLNPRTLIGSSTRQTKKIE